MRNDKNHVYFCKHPYFNVIKSESIYFLYIGPCRLLTCKILNSHIGAEKKLSIMEYEAKSVGEEVPTFRRDFFCFVLKI
jgi:hypothetical protein